MRVHGHPTVVQYLGSPSLQLHNHPIPKYSTLNSTSCSKTCFPLLCKPIRHKPVNLREILLRLGFHQPPGPLKKGLNCLFGSSSRRIRLSLDLQNFRKGSIPTLHRCLQRPPGCRSKEARKPCFGMFCAVWAQNENTIIFQAQHEAQYENEPPRLNHPADPRYHCGPF